jgi:hypothetical protein
MKKENAKMPSAFPLWMAWGILGAALLVLFLLNLLWGDHWLESDMSAEMIFSKQLFLHGELLATDKWYYSTEFRVLYTQIFMEPLFALTKSWHVVRMVTNCITYVLLLLAYFFVCKPLRVKKSITILTSVILLLPLSETFMIHVQMGNTYMPHMIILFFSFGMFLRLSGEKRKISFHRIILLICYLLLGLVCGLSGVRYLLALQVPLCVASVVYLMKSEEWAGIRGELYAEKVRHLFAEERFSYLKFSILGALAALAGYAMNVVLIASKYQFQTYEATNFIKVYQGIFLERVQNTLGSLLMLFGYIDDRAFLSLRGLVTICAFVFIGLIVFVALRTGRLLKAKLHTGISVNKKEWGHRRFLLYFFVTAFLVNTFVFLFTNSTIVSRYYLTVFQFALPILAVYMEEEKYVLDRLLVKLILVCCLLLAAGKVTYSFITVDKNADKRQVAAFLKDNGYDFGYATYNYANIIQELTDGTVEIANISDLGDMSFFRWSSPTSYYDEDYGTGKVFLLTSLEEAGEYEEEPALLAGTVVYEDNWFRVYAYDRKEDLLQYQKTGKEAT